MKKQIELMDQLFLICRRMHRSHHQHNHLDHKESFRGQGRVLSLLKAHPGICQKELAELLDIRSQSIGEILMKLERNGYINRIPKESDRRVMCIHLTAEGLEAAVLIQKKIQKATTVFDCLSQHEQNNLANYLSRIITAMEETEKMSTHSDGRP